MQARKRHTFTLLFRTRTKEGKDERFTRIQREKKKKRLFVRRAFFVSPGSKKPPGVARTIIQKAQLTPLLRSLESVRVTNHGNERRPRPRTVPAQNPGRPRRRLRHGRHRWRRRPPVQRRVQLPARVHPPRRIRSHSKGSAENRRLLRRLGWIVFHV